MIARLIPKSRFYCCSECRIKQPLGPYCIFCGAIFSNFEETLLKNFKEIENKQKTENTDSAAE